MTGIDREHLGEWLSAYLDGELEAPQSAEIERLLQQDADARQMLNELRRAAELVSSLPRHPAPTTIRDEVLRHAERLDLLGAESSSGRRVGRRRAPRLAVISMAAAVGFVAIGAWYFGEYADGPAGSIFTSVDSPLSDAGTASAERVADAAASPPGSGLEKHKDETDSFDRVATVLSSATFEQKLQAGEQAEALTRHPFDNETIRLQVPVATEGAADAAVEEVVAFLAGRQAMDLSQVQGANANVGNRANAAFLTGKPGVNFHAENQRQILVRAPKGEVAGLLDRLAEETASSDQVVLAAGPFSIRGVDNVQAALSGSVGANEVVIVDRKRSDKADWTAAKEYGETEAAAQSEHPTTQLVDSLMHALRLQTPRQSTEPAAADTSTSDARMETSPTVATNDRRTGLDDRVFEDNADAKGVGPAARDSSSFAVKEATADDDNAASAPETTLDGATGKAKLPSLVERRVADLQKQSISSSENRVGRVSREPAPATLARTKSSPPDNFSTRDEASPKPADDQVTLVIQVISEPKEGGRGAPTGPSALRQAKPPKKSEQNRNAE